MRALQITVLIVVSLFLVASVVAQSPNGTINGLVLDPSGRAIVGAEITIVNDATRVQYSGKTNSEGIYVVTNLPPGPYRLQVSKVGFKTLVKPDIVLNVQDALGINFTLPIGAASETVTVTGGVPLLNTESGAVSTVVDREFVENIPLNGRSFQTLIALTPGVVLTPASYGEQGQFSVNGQRADANYFTVDGVSANIGIAAGSGLTQGAGGALPGLSALGGTSSLVSVDAMQEFRIQTSSFAPEFGRTPGGQVSIVTRSGTNGFHGTLFDYFRNDVLDANDWFSNHNGLAKPKERQNDFGGVFAGPIIRDRTFFFFSYEGLRLRQPQSQETVVPDSASRQLAPIAIQPYLNAFPVQNGPELGSNFAQFNASYANPSTLDAYSIRVDQVINTKLTLFGRYSYSPSEAVQRGTESVLSTTGAVSINTQTITLGLTESITQNMSNEVRANFSNFRAGSTDHLDNFGGAVPLPDTLLFPVGFSSGNSFFGFQIFGAGSLIVGKNETNEQRQLNFLDNFSVTTGPHQVKFGVDYRWLAPLSSPLSYFQEPVFFGMTGSGGVLSGVPLVAAVEAVQGSSFLIRNFSIYGQDSWKVTPRLTLTYGLRWDVNPALKGKNATSQPFTVNGLEDPATLSLAVRGVPLYNTSYGNVAPRLGVAYQLARKREWETVLRGGFGVFYDLGIGSLGNLSMGFPFTALNIFAGVPFPLTPQQAAPPAFNLNPPLTSPLYVADHNLKLPRTYQWNVALEQSLGASQTFSLTYVGALGRDLLRQDTLFGPNPNFQSVFVTGNTATSDYHALQLKFQRRVSRGLQALASYSFSHCIDIASNDSGTFNTPAAANSPGIDRGNCDFDVRHSFTEALTYDVPAPGKKKIEHAILGGWSVDSFVLARSAPPVNVIGSLIFVGGTAFNPRPDVIPGTPLYLFGSQFPGGKGLNPGAFVPAASGQQGDLGRNVLRGFGAWQADFALHRQFHLTERLSLQFRAELFNIFNHPNFGNPDNTLGDPLFGKSTETLASSLGAGGLQGGFNPLYQIGGPRSIQFALKLQF